MLTASIFTSEPACIALSLFAIFCKTEPAEIISTVPAEFTREDNKTSSAAFNVISPVFVVNPPSVTVNSPDESISIDPLVDVIPPAFIVPAPAALEIATFPPAFIVLAIIFPAASNVISPVFVVNPPSVTVNSPDESISIDPLVDVIPPAFIVPAPFVFEITTLFEAEIASAVISCKEEIFTLPACEVIVSAVTEAS